MFQNLESAFIAFERCCDSHRAKPWEMHGHWGCDRDSREQEVPVKGWDQGRHKQGSAAHVTLLLLASVPLLSAGSWVTYTVSVCADSWELLEPRPFGPGEGKGAVGVRGARIHVLPLVSKGMSGKRDERDTPNAVVASQGAFLSQFP